MADIDYNPAEVHLKLQEHARECQRPRYWKELPATQPPGRRELQEFIEGLRLANRAVARSSL